MSKSEKNSIAIVISSSSIVQVVKDGRKFSSVSEDKATCILIIIIIVVVIFIIINIINPGKDYCQNEEFIADCYNDQLLLQQHLPHNYNPHQFNNNYNYKNNNNNYNYNNNVGNFNNNNNYKKYNYENYPPNQQPYYQPQPQQQTPHHYPNTHPLKDRVVLMTRAHYGRKKKGFCVKTDFGFVGCYENVIKQTHARCSGLRGCVIDIPDPEFDSTKPCIEDLKNYLDAEYVCLDGG